MSAFPPDEDLIEMWAYRHHLASGKDAKGSTENPPLQTGQYLNFLRVRMSHYLSIPQLTPLNPPKVPDSFSNIAKKDKLPSNVSVPAKQHLLHEKISRECVQVLEHVG